jgi:hypothetical protein
MTSEIVQIEQRRFEKIERNMLTLYENVSRLQNQPVTNNEKIQTITKAQAKEQCKTDGEHITWIENGRLCRGFRMNNKFLVATIPLIFDSNY